jgi:EsV-1-7 cysteine-rich motif/Zinc finger, C2H2 type
MDDSKEKAPKNPRLCQEDGCTKTCSYNYPDGETKNGFCGKHKKPNMINTKNKKCQAAKCPLQASFNYPSESKGLFCGKHKLVNMINVKSKTCQENLCPKRPNFGLPGTTKAIFCKTHNALCRKRHYHKYQRQYCFYVWKDPSPNYLRHKLGYSDRGIDGRLEDERTVLPDFKLVMLVYTMKAEFLEKAMLNHFNDKRLEPNHEIISGVSSEEIIVATQKTLDFFKLEYEIEPDISEYNLTPPNEQMNDDVKAMITEILEKKIDAEMNPKQRFPCTWPGCTKSYTKKCHLSRHIKDFHTKTSQVKCPECEMVLSCADSLKSHLLTHEEKKPVCLVCNKELSNQSSLSRHMLSVHGDNGKIACPQCKKLISKSNLRLHIKRIHEKSVQFPCKKCGKVLASKANYDYHVEKVCPDSVSVEAQVCGNK